jgi:hypothetical protein
MHRGYIKSWRKMVDWEWFKDSHTFHLFHYILYITNHHESNYQGHKILPGQCVTGLHSLSVNTGISKQSVRTSLKRLKSTNEITIKSTNQFSIITVINWTSYQEFIELPNKPKRKSSNKQLTNDQQTTNNILNIIELKNDNKEPIVDFNNNSDKYIITRKGHKLNGNGYEDFMLFWDAFDYKEGKASAADAWMDIPKEYYDIDKIIAGAKQEAERRQDLITKGKTPKMAQGWLSDRRWENEISKPKQFYKIIE